MPHHHPLKSFHSILVGSQEAAEINTHFPSATLTRSQHWNLSHSIGKGTPALFRDILPRPHYCQPSSWGRAQDSDGADNVSLFMLAARSLEANVCPKYLWPQVDMLSYLQFQVLLLVASFSHLICSSPLLTPSTDASIVPITYTLYSSFCNHQPNE